MGKEEKKEKCNPVVVAGYKVDLHCPQCAQDIRKPLLRTTGTAFWQFLQVSIYNIG